MLKQAATSPAAQLVRTGACRAHVLMCWGSKHKLNDRFKLH